VTGYLTIGVLALGLVGCDQRILHVHYAPTTCADGLPVRLLIDVACREGVCGYTCAPDRWRQDPPPKS
jgi:hypothetical protein